jgi:dGTPase
VGRTLGEALADTLIRDAGEKYNPTLPAGIIPDDVGNIVQAACLAHDIGNPPFGHSGEEAIIHWFIQNRSLLPESLSDDMSHDIGALEGNAQGYRVITQIENHVFNGGLQLTYATLGAFQKYPWSSRRRVKKFGAYISEEEILDRVSEGLGLQRRSPHGWRRHPLAHLVEAADDICYAILDVEDAVELEIVTFEEAKRLLVKVLSESERSELEQSLAPPGMYRVNFARLRGRVFDRAISAALRAFLAGYTQIMAGNYDGSLMELLPEEDPCRLLINEAKQLGREKIYVYTKKVEIEIGA